MTKGRRFVPSSAPAGAWYRHVGQEQAPGLELTSTGEMLNAQFRPETAVKPRPPPGPFRSKTEINYKSTNRFTDHDNRHHFQDHGVYFGDGRSDRFLGRMLINSDDRLHHTQKTYLRHNCLIPTDYDYDSTYGKSYIGVPTEHPPRYRRFPKTYKFKKPEVQPEKLDTSTTDWYQPPDVPHRTPMQVMASSQEPFLTHNAWKYSYNRLRKVYPPYDRRTEPIVDNQFNKYGADFLRQK